MGRWTETERLEADQTDHYYQQQKRKKRSPLQFLQKCAQTWRSWEFAISGDHCPWSCLAFSFAALPGCIVISIRDRGGLMPRAKEQPNAGVHPCAGRCGAGSQWPDRGTTQSAMMLSTSYHPVCGPVHACWHGGNCPMRSLPRPPPPFLPFHDGPYDCTPCFVLTALVVHVSHVCVYACRSPQGTTQS